MKSTKYEAPHYAVVRILLMMCSIKMPTIDNCLIDLPVY